MREGADRHEVHASRGDRARIRQGETSRRLEARTPRGATYRLGHLLGREVIDHHEIGTGRERLVDEYPHLDFLWLDTEESEGEVFWITREQLLEA